MSFFDRPPDADDPNVIWDFGWIAPDLRSTEESRADQQAKASLAPFVLQGKNRYGEERKAFLWECWKHPDAVAQMKFGKVYPGVHQITGSCVGAGGCNYLYSLACVEMIRLGEPELAVVPFWLLPYGRSRYYLGDRGPGEGSLGSTFAKAVLEDGYIEADRDGLPTYTSDDGLIWGRNVELSWSDGDEKKTLDLLPHSRKHLVKTCAQIRNADDAREAIVGGFPFGFCGDWGGLMECPVTEGVLLNRRAGSWNHQQSCHGWWDHPKLGEIFYILNQWGLRTHGICPTGAPPGGYWIKKNEMEYQCRNGECFVPSQFNGFPAPDRPLSWIF
jgi:hypothetical protein